MKKIHALCAVTLLTASTSLFATTISYTNFSDQSALTLNGSAASINPVPGSDALRLTNSLGQSGSAFLTDSIALADGGGFQASFSTYFQFQITNPQGISDQDGQGADGLTFVVQTVANNVGGAGGGIGYQGINNSVVIEFDTWNNGAVDDNDGNHVGIALNGNIDSVVQQTVATRMNNGAIWSAWVDYNGLTDLLEVRLSQNGSRPDDVLVSLNVDLVSILGVPDAFIGFTSGTGAAGGYHDILSWEFTNTFSPINNVPEPAAIALLGFGLIGLTFMKRSRA